MPATKELVFDDLQRAPDQHERARNGLAPLCRASGMAGDRHQRIETPLEV